METLYIQNEISDKPEVTKMKVRAVNKLNLFFHLRNVFCCLLFVGTSFMLIAQNGQLKINKRIYAPGENILISGNDFLPLQPVSIVVSKVGVLGSEQIVVATADAAGKFSNAIYTISPTDENTNYEISILGSANKAGPLIASSALGLTQVKNGGVGDPPIDPVEWINGNSNGQKSHYQEGQSIPYRVILDLNGKTYDPATVYELKIEFDIVHGGKHAIDFITSYNRDASLGGINEAVLPVDDVDPLGDVFVNAEQRFNIPAPTQSIDVNGKPQPTSAFNQIKNAKLSDAQFSAFNAVIVDMYYLDDPAGGVIEGEGDVTSTGNSKAEIVIKYQIAPGMAAGKQYIMFAWAGHIADRRDWGPGSSCASINGSPYHTNMTSESDFVGGDEDRALATDAVQFFPSCELDAPDLACVGDVIIATATTDAPSPHFLWSATGGATISVSGPDDATAEVTVPSGGGSFVISVDIVDYFDGQEISEHSICYDTVDIKSDPVVSAGDDQEQCLGIDGRDFTVTGSVSAGAFVWTVESGVATIDSPNSLTTDVHLDASNNSVVLKLTALDTCVEQSDLVTLTVNLEPVVEISTADDPDCKDNSGSYSVQSGAGLSYQWAISGDATINGSSTSNQVAVLVDNLCDVEFELSVIVTDENGCIGYDTLDVEFADSIAPEIGDAGDDEVVLCTEGYEFDPPSATDACDDEPNLHVIPEDTLAGDCPAEMVITKGWYFEDACGNKSDTVYQSISIVDTIAPIIDQDAGADEVVLCTEGYEFDPPSATDNCDEDPDMHVIPEDTIAGDCPSEMIITKGWYFEDACGNKSDTVYQTISIVDTIAPIISEAEGDDEVVLCTEGYEFDPPSATDNCDEDPQMHVIPEDTIQGDCPAEMMITKGWYFEDACENKSDTVYQTISIVDTLAPVLSNLPDDEEVLCTEQYAFDAPSAEDNCDDSPEIHGLPLDTIPGNCPAEMMITKGWYAEDACGNKSDTVYQTISIVDTIAPSISGEGDDYEIDCNEEAVFYPPTASDLCGDADIIPDGPDSTEVDGNIQITMTWYAVDECGNASDTVDQTITVLACNEVFCSLTQGFYGNAKGVACATGERGKDLLIRILGPEFGPLVIGSGSRTLTFDDSDVECLIKVMPAGGPSVILPDGNNTFGANCSLPADFLGKSGRLKSVVWGQVITLGLNLRLDVDLGNVELDGNQFSTGEAEAGDDDLCGTDDDVFVPGDGLVKQIPQSVLDALDDEYAGDRSIYNLFLLANRVLGGETIAGVSVLDINAAASAINEGFDHCRFLEGFDDTKDQTATVEEELVIDSEMNYKVFPNPFNDATTIAFVTSESMNVQVEVFAINGDKVATLYNDLATANTEYRVVLNGAQLQNGVYFVRIISEGGVYETRIILNK